MTLVAPFPAVRNSALPAHGAPRWEPTTRLPASRESAVRSDVHGRFDGPHLRLVSPHALAPTQAPRRPRPVRLTRRGHVVLFAASCLALFGIVLGSGAVADAAVQQGQGSATATVLVEHGDSLWSIAQGLSSGADPRPMVHRIQELNGIGDWPIVPGQRLVVPVVAASG